MHKAIVSALMSVLVAVSLSAPVLAADAPAAGSKLIFIAVDPAAEGLDAGLVKQREQIVNLMEREFPKVFARFAKQGYTGEMIANEGAYMPGEGRYLLKVKIAEYRAGSKAARIIVGFGAGGASLKCTYELSSDGKTALLASEAGCYSGVEWTKAVRKVEELIVKAVTDKLGA